MITQATIDIDISHISGPASHDPNHVLAWFVASEKRGDSAGGFAFDACPQHAGPQACNHNVDELGVYRVRILAARCDGPTD